MHEDLIAHHEAVLAGARRILVPLAGRSLDLAWLEERGHEVVGVEIVEEVVAGYFADRGLDVVPTAVGPFRAYRSGRLTVLVGDMLAATPAVIGTFDGVWDRAALVALASTDRPPYADALRRLMPPGARMLLQTFACDRAPDTGPPFRVDDAEVRSLYAGADVRLIGERPPGPEGWPLLTYRVEMETPSAHSESTDGSLLGMKMSVSLPDDDVDFLDRYAARRGMPSRSAAVRRAVDLLRAEDLGPAYADAWRTWASEEADVWEVTVDDGLRPR